MCNEDQATGIPGPSAGGFGAIEPVVSVLKYGWRRAYSFAGRKRKADQVPTIDTWRTGCTPWEDRAAASRSRFRSVPSWPPPLGFEQLPK